MSETLTLKQIPSGIDAAFPRYSISSSVIDMRKCFWPLDRLIADLLAGEVSFAGATPIMLDHDGAFGEILPSIEGWCSALERIARAIRLPLDLGHMRRVARRLEAGMLLDVVDIDRFIAQTDRCRAIYLACPVWIRQAECVVECIDIEVTGLGLKEAA